jgi:hypothetical protein
LRHVIGAKVLSLDRKRERGDGVKSNLGRAERVKRARVVAKKLLDMEEIRKRRTEPLLTGSWGLKLDDEEWETRVEESILFRLYDTRRFVNELFNAAATSLADPLSFDDILKLFYLGELEREGIGLPGTRGDETFRERFGREMRARVLLRNKERSVSQLPKVSEWPPEDEEGWCRHGFCKLPRNARPCRGCLQDGVSFRPPRV